MQWPGVEPSKGQYNFTYLNAMKQLVADLVRLSLNARLAACLIDWPLNWHFALSPWQGTFGIYTYLDFHQDSGSELFCGEGLPTWAVETQGAPGFPIPLEKVPCAGAVPAGNVLATLPAVLGSIDAAACGAALCLSCWCACCPTYYLLTALTRPVPVPDPVPAEQHDGIPFGRRLRQARGGCSARPSFFRSGC